MEKAEEDYAVATRELAWPSPVFNAVCFHAQRSLEKHIRVLLQERGIAVPRTHDLSFLATLTATELPALDAHQPDLKSLTIAAIDLRYPGTSAIRGDADLAARIAAEVRALIRAALDVPSA